MREFRVPVDVYLVGFLVVGLSLSLLGPSLTDLRGRSGSGIGGIGVLFAGQSLGYIIGSIVGGRLYDRLDGHRVLALAFTVLALGLAIVPTFHSVVGFSVAFAIIGAGAGAADVGANTMLMWDLQAGSGRAMNMLHMCFGLGALSAPLAVHASLDASVRGAAAAGVGIAMWLWVVPAPTAPAAARDEHTPHTRPMLAVLATFFFLYVGVEVGFAGWIHTYGEEVRFSTLAATWLTTVFWTGFTLGRLLASALGHRFQPKVLLTGSCSLTLLAAIVLIVGDGRTGAVWAGAAMMGVATAPQFPVMLIHLERHIQVSGTATAWFVAAAGLGGLIFPWLIGQWFDAKGASTLPWAILVLALATLSSFVVSNRRLAR